MHNWELIWSLNLSKSIKSKRTAYKYTENKPWKELLVESLLKRTVSPKTTLDESIIGCQSPIPKNYNESMTFHDVENNNFENVIIQRPIRNTTIKAIQERKTINKVAFKRVNSPNPEQIKLIKCIDNWYLISKRTRCKLI